MPSLSDPLPLYVADAQTASNSDTLGGYPLGNILAQARSDAASDASSKYLPLSGGSLSGQMFINSSTYNNYREGIRINRTANGYASLNLGGAPGTTEGLAANTGQWWFGAGTGPGGNLQISDESSYAETGFVLYGNGNAPTWKGATMLTSSNVGSYTAGAANKLQGTLNGVTYNMYPMNSGWFHMQQSQPIYVLNTSGGDAMVFDGNIRPYGDNARYNGTSGARWYDVRTVRLNGATPITSSNVGSYKAGSAYTADGSTPGREFILNPVNNDVEGGDIKFIAADGDTNALYGGVTMDFYRGGIRMYGRNSPNGHFLTWSPNDGNLETYKINGSVFKGTMVPNWDGATNFPDRTGITAPSNGYVLRSMYGRASSVPFFNAEICVWVGGLEMCQRDSDDGGARAFGLTLMIPVKKGDYFSTTSHVDNIPPNLIDIAKFIPSY